MYTIIYILNSECNLKNILLLFNKNPLTLTFLVINNMYNINNK